MSREFTQEEADRHNEFTAKGWDIIRENIFIHESENQEPPADSGQTELESATNFFLEALKINPEGWSSMWALGKVYQRLGRHDESLDWFGKALKLNPSQPNVAREAGLAALDVGEIPLGLQYCLLAVENDPDDPGLVCNLALAYSLAGDDKNATRCANEAVQRAPDDSISKTVLEFVNDVRDGKVERPKKLEDAFPN